VLILRSRRNLYLRRTYSDPFTIMEYSGKRGSLQSNVKILGYSYIKIHHKETFNKGRFSYNAKKRMTVEIKFFNFLF